MKLFLAILLCGLSSALAEEAPPPVEKTNQQKRVEADKDDISKELESFQKQAEDMFKQIEKFTSSPQGAQGGVEDTRRKAMKLASDDRFLKAAGDLWAHPSRNKLLLIQVAFFIFMLILKAWRQSRCSHWFKRLIVGFLFSIITWAGLLYAIPLLVLGEPFAVFTSTLWRVVFAGG